jgi:hypothetical protein
MTKVKHAFMPLNVQTSSAARKRNQSRETRLSLHHPPLLPSMNRTSRRKWRGFSLCPSEGERERERIPRTSDACFGHMNPLTRPEGTLSSKGGEGVTQPFWCQPSDASMSSFRH